MKYTIVFTHNPQDYFEGMEPGELAVYREVDAKVVVEVPAR